MFRIQNKSVMGVEKIQWCEHGCKDFLTHQKTKDNAFENCPFSMQTFMRGWGL